MSEADEALILSDEDMQAPQLAAFAGGSAALFSMRCPGKDGPNEDGAALLPAGDGRGVLVVADGMGGRPAGATASAMAISCLRDCLGEAADEASLRAAILDGIEQANRRILELGMGAGTTLVVAELSDGIAEIGGAFEINLSPSDGVGARVGLEDLSANIDDIRKLIDRRGKK